jgi:hypothetical protein
MTYLVIGIAIVLAVVIALVIRASRHTYNPASGGAMGANGRQTKLASQERSTRWGAGA